MEQIEAQTWGPRALPAEGRQQETFEGASRPVLTPRREAAAAGGRSAGGADTAACTVLQLDS